MKRAHGAKRLGLITCLGLAPLAMGLASEVDALPLPPAVGTSPTPPGKTPVGTTPTPKPPAPKPPAPKPPAPPPPPPPPPKPAPKPKPAAKPAATHVAKPAATHGDGPVEVPKFVSDDVTHPLPVGSDDAPAAAPEAAPDAVDQLTAARLADLDYSRHFDLLVARLGDPSIARRVDAIRQFGPLQDQRAVPLLLPFLDASTRRPDELQAAIDALCDLGATSAADGMRRLTGHADVDVRASATSGLMRLEAIAANDHLRGTRDPSAPLRGSGAENLGALKAAEGADQLKRLLAHDEDPHVRRLAAIALGRLGDTANAPALMQSLCDADPGVRRYASEALARLDDKAATPELLMALEGNIAAGRVDHSLDVLIGQDFGFDTHANQVERTAAVDKGFAWWTANEKSLK